MSIDIRADLRPLFGATRDQGSRPTCMAFAASDTHAAIRGPFDALSVEFAHYHAVQRKVVRDPNAGVPLRLMADAIEQNGQPVESGWPYILPPPVTASAWRPPTNPGPLFRCKTTRGLGKVSKICTHLDARRPVIVVLRISLLFHKPPKDAVIHKTSHDSDTGIHAVVAVGYGTEKKERLILIRNSWGAGWGIAGHVWLCESYVRARLSEVAVM